MSGSGSKASQRLAADPTFIELVTEAWGGRNTSTYLREPPGSPHNYQEKVLDVRPDLIVSEFVNDAGLGPAQVEERYGRLLADFGRIGAEWIILTPHYVRPDWMGLTREREIEIQRRLAVPSACVLMLLRRMWRPSEIVHFAAPTITIAAVLVSHEWNVARGEAWTRLKHWAYQWGLFGLGVAAPVSGFLIPYVHQGGLWELYLGLFVRPEQRFEFAALAMPGLISFVPVVVWALPLALAGRLAGRPRTKAAAALCWSMCLVPCAAVLWACRSQLVYNVIWCSALNAVPVVCIAGCAFLLVSHRESGREAQRLEQLFLLVLAAQLISLQQFPFALAVYFFYGAPLLVLAGLHLIARLPGRSARVGLCLAAFYLAFAVLWMNPAFNVGFTGGWSPHARLMDSPRCGLCIPEREARLYESVVKLIQQNSSPGSSILALPDCPEVHFLADRKNPTRRIYDFLTDATGRGDEILDVLEEQPIPVVVINTRPLHSPPVDHAATLARLARIDRAGKTIEDLFRQKVLERLLVTLGKTFDHHFIGHLGPFDEGPRSEGRIALRKTFQC